MGSKEFITQLLECLDASRAVEYQPSVHNSQRLVAAINLAGKMLDIYVERQVEIKLANVARAGKTLEDLKDEVKQDGQWPGRGDAGGKR